MSTLAIYDNSDSAAPREVIKDHAEIGTRLKALGVRFERWQIKSLPETADQADVLAAYEKDVGRLNEEYGFQSLDVVALRPDHPKKAELRSKFLEEHIHNDFEVRYFVQGRGLFYLNLGDTVWAVLCEEGDLISVPAGTLHWYDMGANPDFKCIRLFVVPDGWVAEFSGSGIAARYPTFDQFVESYA